MKRNAPYPHISRSFEIVHTEISLFKGYDTNCDELLEIQRVD